METSLRTGFAQIFSRCPKNLSCPKFGGTAAPLAPPRPVRLCFCHGAETRDPRAEADPIGIRDRWIMNPLTTRLRCLLPNLLPYLTCAKRVFWPYIIYKTKKFLEKKFQWPNKYTKCRVSDFLTRYYSTDLGIIETTLKTSFSRSHFRLFFSKSQLSLASHAGVFRGARISSLPWGGKKNELP